MGMSSRCRCHYKHTIEEVVFVSLTEMDERVSHPLHVFSTDSKAKSLAIIVRTDRRRPDTVDYFIIVISHEYLLSGCQGILQQRVCQFLLLHVHVYFCFVVDRTVTEITAPAPLSSVAILRDGSTLVGGGSDGMCLMPCVLVGCLKLCCAEIRHIISTARPVSIMLHVAILQNNDCSIDKIQ